MSSKKDIVDLIRKMAQSYTPSQSEGQLFTPKDSNVQSAPAPTTPSVPDVPRASSPAGAPVLPSVPRRNKHQSGSAQSTGTGQGNKEIIAMQQALVDLANEVTAQITPPNQPTDLNTPQGSRTAGRDSFADFLAKTFMRNSELSVGIKAVEFSPDSTKTNVPEKEPRDPSKMSWVMDTMQRIGSQSSEKVVDGIWGPRTNTALRNVCAFASALFALSLSLHVQQNAYSQEKLNNLIENMRPKDTDFSITEKLHMAGNIKTHIDAIRVMYEQIKKQVLENPKYKDYIEGTKSYVTHGSFEVSPQELETIKKQYPRGWYITIGDGSRDLIRVDDISSIENINRWVDAHQTKTEKSNPGLNSYSVLQQIKAQIQSSTGVERK